MKYFAALLAAVALLSCEDATMASGGDGVDGELEDVVIQNESDSSQGDAVRTVKGLAADGKSKLVAMIPADSSNPATQITIESDVEWGVVSGDETIHTIDGEEYYIYTLTSQEELPAALSDSDVATINYTIEAVLSDGSVKSATKSIEVVRPVVIFAHGLASGAETFDPMLGYIRDMGLFVESALYALDYLATSLSSYETNNRVIPNAIDDCFAGMLDDGYVAGKATLIGHSMGGILSRIYLQDGVFNDDGITQKEPYRDDVLKIITIDTPHSGSQLADFALEIGENDSPLAIFSKMGAIVDLAVESAATADLNSASKLAVANALQIPTHIITAEIGTLSGIVELVQDEQYAIAALSFLLDAVGSKLLYGDDTSDIVVPMKSQQGGVQSSLLKSYITNYDNEWHCTVHTTLSAAQDVVELLDTEGSNSKVFTKDGFDPETLSYDDNLLSSVKIDLQEGEIPADGIITSITIGLDSDDNIISLYYEGVEMGDESAAVATIEIARIENPDNEDVPYIVYQKTQKRS